MASFIQIKKKRLNFHIMRELSNLEELIKELPEKDIYKFISNGHFSSIAFIKFIAEITHIKKMTVSTLRVGKKHLAVLDELHKQRKIDKVNFVIGSVMKNDNIKGKEYGYFDVLTDVCDKNNWKITVLNNHSKILLFDTDDGYFVIETSSNLNENPNIEQFSFEKSKKLYDMYYGSFVEWGVIDGG